MTIGSISNGELGLDVRNKLNLAISAANQAIVNTNIVYVNSAAGFPTPSAGVITLAASTTYIITTFVTVSDTIKFSAGSKLAGANRFACFLNYTGTGDIFTNTASGSMAIDELGIIGGANGTVFNFVGAGAETMILSNSYVVSCKKVGTIDDIRTIVFRSFSVVAASDLTNGGLIIKSTTPGAVQAFNMDNSYWADGITNGTMVDIQATQVERIQIPTGNRFNTASGVTGLKVLASNGNFTTGVGIISHNIFEGVGTPTSGLTNSDIRWDILGNEGLSDSSQDAQGYCHTAETTVLVNNDPTLMTFSANFVDAHSNQFTVSTGGRITYIGLETKEFEVRFISNGTTASGTNQIVNHWLYKNGVQVVASKITREYSSGSNGSVTAAAIIDLATNDYIDPYVENDTSTNNWVSNIANIIVKRA